MTDIKIRSSLFEYALENKKERNRKQNNERQKRFAEKQRNAMGVDAAAKG